MTIYFGENIKKLRNDRGITQEALADFLGISFQAVSKWERNESYPDITFIPLLARYFNVSTDDLLGYNINVVNADIENICNEANKYSESKNNIAKGREIIENGLIKYPNNDILLDKLLYFISYNDEPDLTISTAAKLIMHTKSNDLKYNAYRYLAYAYSVKGDTDNSIANLKRIPQLYFTQYSEMAFFLDGKPKYEAANKQKWNSFEILLQMMWKLAEYYQSINDIDKAIKETDNAIKLIDTFKTDIKASDFQNYKEFFEIKIKDMKQNSQ